MDLLTVMHGLPYSPTISRPVSLPIPPRPGLMLDKYHKHKIVAAMDRTEISRDDTNYGIPANYGKSEKNKDLLQPKNKPFLNMLYMKTENGTVRSRPSSPVPKISSDCVYGNIPSLLNRRSTLTPPVVKRSYQPSPAPHRHNWILRHASRSRVNNTDEASSITSNIYAPLSLPSSRANSRQGSLDMRSASKQSTSEESSFLAASSFESVYKKPKSTLIDSDMDASNVEELKGLRRNSSDRLSLLSFGFPSFQLPAPSLRTGSFSKHSTDREGHKTGLNKTRKSVQESIPLHISRSNASFCHYSPAEWFLKPIFYEVPQRDPNPIFIGRDWLYRDIADHLLSHLPTNCGVIIIGSPGSGKTGIILKLVENSCFGSGNFGLKDLTNSLPDPPQFASPLGQSGGRQTANLPILATHVVAYHFCQADNAVTCQVAEWVHSLAAQLSQAPCLKAYHQLLSMNHDLRTLLSLPACLTDPDMALTQAVLLPLTDLHLAGKISADLCIILIDGLCELQSHRPNYGDTISSFVEKHLIRFPAWLKIVATVRSNARDVTRGLPFHTVRLDNYDVDERINKDMCAYITLCIHESTLLRKNIMQSMSRYSDDNPNTRFQKYLVGCAKGSFLYVKLTLDLIERGHLVLKSSNYKVLPRTLSEVFQLEFNLKFPTSKSFENISTILCVCLATRHPLTIEKLYLIVNAVNVSSFITWSEFLSLYRPLVRYIVKRKDDTLMFFHPLFREWLIKRSHKDSNKFLCDPRIGHAAIALSMTRMEPLIESEHVLDICHHILHSNIYKDVPSKIPAAYLQSFWVSLSTDDSSAVLGSACNLYRPNIQISELLLLSGASPDYLTATLHSNPLLCVHAKHGHEDMISLLIQFRADINQCNSLGESVLTLAVMEGRLESVRLLVENGAQINHVDTAGSSLLARAAVHGHLNILEFLVSCDWTACSQLQLREAVQQATVASSAADNVEILDFLLDMSEVMIDGEDTRMRETPLVAAASRGSKDCLDSLLRRGASVNAENWEQKSALHLAGSKGHWSCCEILIKAGSDVNLGDMKGRSVLMMAGIEGHLGVVSLLVASHAAIDQSDDDGVTAVMSACAHGQLETVRYLVDQGADITHADNTGRTALDLAAEQGNCELVRLLLDHGAIMEHVDIHGIRPLDRAVKQANTEVVTCFLKTGSKLGPSTWAAAADRPEIMIILLNKLLQDGNTLYKRKDMEGAALRYSYASKRVPTASQGLYQKMFVQLKMHLLLNLCQCKVRMSEYGAAISLATEVIVQHPACYQAYQARARAHQAAADLDKACQDLTQAVRLTPHDRELCAALIKIKEELRAEEEMSAETRISEAKELSKFCASLGVSWDQVEKSR